MLTIIIPVYNGTKYLLETIESVFSQPCNDYRIILVDDGSFDESGILIDNIILQNPERNIIACHQKNAGVSVARNHGICLVSTDYLAFLDADDLLCKNAYDNTVHELLTLKKYDMLQFSYAETDSLIKKCKPYRVADGPIRPEQVKEQSIRFSSYIYKKSVLRDISFPKEVKYAEDLVFKFLVCSNSTTVFSLNRFWFLYRNNSLSAMHNKENFLNHAETLISAWQFCKDMCNNEDDKRHCNNIIFLTTVEYMELSCKNRVPQEKINELFCIPSVKNCFENYDSLWKDYRERYEEYARNPDRYYKEMVRRGIVLRLFNKLNTIPMFHNLYIKNKFKCSVSELNLR